MLWLEVFGIISEGIPRLPWLLIFLGKPSAELVTALWSLYVTHIASLKKRWIGGNPKWASIATVNVVRILSEIAKPACVCITVSVGQRLLTLARPQYSSASYLRLFPNIQLQLQIDTHCLWKFFKFPAFFSWWICRMNRFVGIDGHAFHLTPAVYCCQDDLK